MWPLSRWERGTRVYARERAREESLSLARERATAHERAGQRKEGGNRGRNRERSMPQGQPRVRSNFCFILCQGENERVSDRLTAPILFTASCQILSASIFLLSFAIPRLCSIIYSIFPSLFRKINQFHGRVLYLTSNLEVFKRSITFVVSFAFGRRLC